MIGLSNAVQVAASESNSCALLVDGTAQCWGDNSYGQLGDGSTDSSWVPIAVPNLTGIVQIVTWFHTCALLIDGTVMCWGMNFEGELGVGGGIHYTPVAVQGLP